LYLRDLLLKRKGGKGDWEGRGEGKVKVRERESRWMGGFGPPKNFGVAPPMLEAMD